MNSRRAFLKTALLTAPIAIALPTATAEPAVVAKEAISVGNSTDEFLKLITWTRKRNEILGQWGARCFRPQADTFKDYIIPFCVKIPETKGLSESELSTEVGLAMESAVKMKVDFERFSPEISKIEWIKHVPERGTGRRHGVPAWKGGYKE